MPAADSSFKQNLCVILVRTRNPLNIGAVARAMANFGASQLQLVAPYDLAFREARSAVGASQLLAKAEVCESVANAVTDCTLVVGTTAATNRSVTLSLVALHEAAPQIAEAAHTGKVALLFGSEKRGLTNQDMSYCHWLMRIPTTQRSPSMNLAQSVVVVLYELARTWNQTPATVESEAMPAADLPAKMRSLLRLAEVMHETLDSSGYYSEAAAASAEEQLRRLLLRMTLTEPDSEIVLGMFRHILWRLRANSSK